MAAEQLARTPEGRRQRPAGAGRAVSSVSAKWVSSVMLMLPKRYLPKRYEM